jgi:hypothetical protein
MTAWIIGSPCQAGMPFRIATFNKGNSMPNLIYRVVSACGALGYGYPRGSLRLALRGRIDAIGRPNISASTDERDVFGFRQQVAIEHMNIPIYLTALAKVSSL